MIWCIVYTLDHRCIEVWSLWDHDTDVYYQFSSLWDHHTDVYYQFSPNTSPIFCPSAVIVMERARYYDFSMVNIVSLSLSLMFFCTGCINTVCEKNLYHPCTGPCFSNPTIGSVVNEDVPKIRLGNFKHPTFLTVFFLIQYQSCTQNIHLLLSNQKV